MNFAAILLVLSAGVAPVTAGLLRGVSSTNSTIVQRVLEASDDTCFDKSGLQEDMCGGKDSLPGWSNRGVPGNGASIEHCYSVCAADEDCIAVQYRESDGNCDLVLGPCNLAEVYTAPGDWRVKSKECDFAPASNANPVCYERVDVEIDLCGGQVSGDSLSPGWTNDGVPQGQSIEKCQEACSENPKCIGVQYHEGTKNCDFVIGPCVFEDVYGARSNNGWRVKSKACFETPTDTAPPPCIGECCELASLDASNASPQYLFPNGCPETIAAVCRPHIAALVRRNPQIKLCPDGTGSSAMSGGGAQWCPTETPFDSGHTTPQGEACYGVVGAGKDMNKCSSGFERFAQTYLAEATSHEHRRACSIVTAVAAHESGFAPNARSWDMACFAPQNGAVGIFQYDFLSGLDPLPAGPKAQLQRFFTDDSTYSNYETLSHGWMACNPRVQGATASSRAEFDAAHAACLAAGAPRDQMQPHELGCCFAGVFPHPWDCGLHYTCPDGMKPFAHTPNPNECSCGVVWDDANAGGPTCGETFANQNQFADVGTAERLPRPRLGCSGEPCENPDECRSEFGYCGTTVDHCPCSSPAPRRHAVIY